MAFQTNFEADPFSSEATRYLGRPVAWGHYKKTATGRKTCGRRETMLDLGEGGCQRTGPDKTIVSRSVEGTYIDGVVPIRE